MAYIPEDKVEDVRAATDIVDVVGDYVRLKKRGANHVGLCPFHNERTPSFNVNPQMGIFKCFGCGEGGNVYQFLMKVEGLTFPEAVRTLAEKAGIPLPEDDPDPEQASEAEAIYHALRFAARFFYTQLTQTPAGRPALDYLEGRGLTPATIKRFGLGYAPDAWDALLSDAERHHLTPEILEKAGLVIERKDGSGYYDRYRGRVIFPIFSHVGKVLGFGGRILAQDSDQPKYINSPETRVYNKSRVLYGLFHGKKAIRREEEAILVEGYTDVISLHQAGVEHVVASSGTALTPDQVKAIGRYARRVLLLYDADAAGAGAALRGIDLVLEQGLAAYAVALPPGADPDSFVREQGAEAFAAFVEKHRQDFVAFRHEQARRSGRLDTPEGAAEAMKEVVASIARIPEPLMRETYLRRASDVLGLYDSQLREVLEGLSDRPRRPVERRAPPPRRPDPGPPRDAQDPPPPMDATEPLPEEKTLIRLMLEQGRSMVEFVLGTMGLDEFSPGAARATVEAFVALYQDGVVDTQRFFDGSMPGPVQQLAAEVMIERHQPSENWERRQGITVSKADPYEEATDAMKNLKLDRVDAAIREQKQRIFRASQDGGGDVRTLQEELMAYYELRKRIERREFLQWNGAT